MVLGWIHAFGLGALLACFVMSLTAKTPTDSRRANIVLIIGLVLTTVGWLPTQLGFNP
jgi:hypothetical protein